MKLLFCPQCNDVFNLKRNQFRTCECGEAGGMYLEDGVNATYRGGVPLGFANTSFVRAIVNQPNQGMGERFEAFVIPKECPTFKEESK